MKNFLITFFFISLSAFSQDFPDGMVAVEFNASFNKSNEVAWLSKLTDCETQRVDIAADSRIFNNNEEVKRFQANIMMTMEATKSEVQNSIDEIVMEAF
jgi:hypothetical protein